MRNCLDSQNMAASSLISDTKLPCIEILLLSNDCFFRSMSVYSTAHPNSSFHLKNSHPKTSPRLPRPPLLLTLEHPMHPLIPSYSDKRDTKRKRSAKSVAWLNKKRRGMIKAKGNSGRTPAMMEIVVMRSRLYHRQLRRQRGEGERRNR